MHALWVSTLTFQLLAEVNELAKADDSKIMMVNPYVAYRCTNRFGSGVVFHKIPRDKRIQTLLHIALELAKPRGHVLGYQIPNPCSPTKIVQSDTVMEIKLIWHVEILI